MQYAGGAYLALLPGCAVADLYPLVPKSSLAAGVRASASMRPVDAVHALFWSVLYVTWHFLRVFCVQANGSITVFRITKDGTVGIDHFGEAGHLPVSSVTFN